MKKRVLIGLVLALALFGLMPGTPAVADGATPERSSWTWEFTAPNYFWVWNPCASEWVPFEGTVHYAVHQVTNASGGYHWVYHARHNLRGVGLSTGKKYQAISNETQHLNDNGPGSAYEWTFMNTSPLISQGDAPNMIFTLRNHLTINADGDWTAYFSYWEFVCRG